MRATSDLLLSIEGLEAVLALGDPQYHISTLDKFLTSYHPTWGRLKEITHPVPGNHEYAVPGGQKGTSIISGRRPAIPRPGTTASTSGAGT